MKEQTLSLSEIYVKGREALAARQVTRAWPPESDYGATLAANRKYLDSLFFVTRYLDPVDDVDTSLTLFGVKLKAPVFCPPISRSDHMQDSDLTDIARGVGAAGAMMMLGIGGNKDVQNAVDAGAPVVKMIKPYRQTDLIFEKARDAEKMGCVAIGMDIDHFYGNLRGTTVGRAELFAPQRTETLRQLIAQTKLPFIIKGVLSLADAVRAVEIGASAIIVSTHGNGSLNFNLPSMIALPKIVEAVGDRVTVLVDSGFKTGSDVLKGLAFGAKAVGFGSSMLLAHAAGGPEMVEHLVNQIAAELRRTMAATGCASLASVNKSIIRELPIPERGFSSLNLRIGVIDEFA